MPDAGNSAREASPPKNGRAPRIAAALFAALAVLTFVSFFAAQRLKAARPYVYDTQVRPKRIAPAAGGFTRTTFTFHVQGDDSMTAWIVNPAGRVVRTLARDRSIEAGVRRLAWNGRDDRGRIAPPGAYRLRLDMAKRGEMATLPFIVRIENGPARFAVREVRPSLVDPRALGRGEIVTVEYTRPKFVTPRELVVYRTGSGRARLVGSVRVRGSATGEIRWDGRVDGKPLGPGGYLVAIRARSSAGVASTTPSRLPPRRPTVRASGAGHPGLNVRPLVVYPRVRSAAEGRRATLRARFGSTGDAGSAAVPFTVKVKRVGAAGAASTIRGVAPSKDGAATIRVPIRSGRSGVYEATVGAEGGSVATPIPVRFAGEPAVTLVLPVMTWQSQRGLDWNRDGWPDDLLSDGRASLNRPAAALPDGYVRQTRPLLEWLEREGLEYGVMTDVELVESAARPPRALLFAGSEEFPPRSLADALREHVRRGGRVALTSDRSFFRTATLSLRTIRSPSPVGPDAFTGATARPLVGRAAFSVLSDRDGVLAGLPAPFATFGSSELLDIAPTDAALGGAAGPGSPALVLYESGAGFVFRSGSGGWSEALRRDTSVALVTRRVWDRLSR